jgi:hypothetical protein
LPVISAIGASINISTYPNIVFPGIGELILFITTITGPVFYALIRPRYIKKYVKEGLEKALIEFETIKKIIPIILVIIAFILYLSVTLSVTYSVTYQNPQYEFLRRVLPVNSLLFMIPGISSLAMYGRIISEEGFRFYLAKTYFMGAPNKKDVFRQMHYFSLGLREYNRYLKRNLKHQIKDIDKIFSKVSLLDNNDAITEVIRSLSNNFETENDKLKPLRYISSKLMKSNDTESILVPESLKSRLKVLGTFLTASIPIVISIIALILKK